MRPADLTEIRQLTLFDSMADSQFEELMQAAYLQTFPPQVELITEGEQADFLHIVVDGCVELFARSNGRESTLNMVRPVKTFILAAVLSDAVYLMSARTCQRSRVLMLPAYDVRRVFQQDEIFARAIVGELAASYRGVVKGLKNHKLRTGVERLANLLLQFNLEQGERGTINLPYDKRTVASLLGMTPENLSRALNTLRGYGVEVQGAEVTLTDTDSLRVLAKPNKLIDDSDV